MLAFWISLAVFVLSLGVGLFVATRNGLAAWRQLKRTSRVFGDEMARIAQEATRLETHLHNADAASTRLRAALDRLAVSRAMLNVQLAAIKEARATVDRIFWFVPGR